MTFYSPTTIQARIHEQATPDDLTVLIEWGLRCLHVTIPTEPGELVTTMCSIAPRLDGWCVTIPTENGGMRAKSYPTYTDAVRALCRHLHTDHRPWAHHLIELLATPEERENHDDWTK